MPDSPEAKPLESARAKQREVLQEVAAHSESESARLLALLRKTEDFTRQISNAEAQIQRQEELQAHLREALGTLTKRRRPDVGLVAGRYTLEMQGNHQRLQISDWEEVPYHAVIDFSWDPDTWYTMKMRVDLEADRAIIR